jgi:hypothetical protein
MGIYLPVSYDLICAQKATKLFYIGRILNTKLEIPAFAEAAPRRQAKLETISNDQISNVPNKRV